MPKKKSILQPDPADLSSLYLPEMTFGEYMREVRKAQKIKLRELAKAVNKTPTYISDIENGNNRPPDKELLDAILSALKVNEFPQLCGKLYDLAAFGRGDIPADVKAFVIENPDAILILRSLQSNPNPKKILAEMASHYCNGGNNNDIK